MEFNRLGRNSKIRQHWRGASCLVDFPTAIIHNEFGYRMLEVLQFLKTVRLGEVEKGRGNNLNLLRLLCASAVIFSHCFVLRGEYAREPMHAALGWGDLGETAVFCFFFISGYLILKSALSRSTPEEFIAARTLRIFPALMVAIMLCAFVLGPVASTLSVSDYFRDPLTRTFLRDAWLHRTQDALPGVFENNPIRNVVDGPIWTLPVEWTMYMVTLAACAIVRWKSSASRFTARSWAVLIAALILTVQMFPLPWPTSWMWIACFLLGSACYPLRSTVPLSPPFAVAFLSLDLLCFHKLPFHLGAKLFPLALCYCLITFGYHPAAHVKSFHRLGDYSYGLYVFAWPLQQFLVNRTRGAISLFAATYVLALLAAVCSWHFIEKPCLALKDRVRYKMSAALYQSS
jgi:peptidoglycan/LPS O-acetylase OafA/YrhL